MYWKFQMIFSNPWLIVGQQTQLGTLLQSTRSLISSMRRWKSSPSMQTETVWINIWNHSDELLPKILPIHSNPLSRCVETYALYAQVLNDQQVKILLHLSKSITFSWNRCYLRCSGVWQSRCFVPTGDESGPWKCQSSGEDPKKQFIAVLINAVWSCKDVIMVLGQQICYEQFLDFKSWIMLLGLVGVTWSGFDPYLYLCLFSKVFVFNFRSTGAWSHCKLRAM